MAKQEFEPIPSIVKNYKYTHMYYVCIYIYNTTGDTGWPSQTFCLCGIYILGEKNKWTNGVMHNFRQW